MTSDPSALVQPRQTTRELPDHLRRWALPPEWRWGDHGIHTGIRHVQEVIDALGRSLALVSVPDPAHATWLRAEARRLAHVNHPVCPVTYHHWIGTDQSPRGPGYLRRWLVGETAGERLRRRGRDGVPEAIRTLRAVGSALAYLHDDGSTHGAIAPDTIFVTPTGRLWILGWHWAVPRDEIPDGLEPDPVRIPRPPECADRWAPTPATDQWQLGALCFALLTGELPPAGEVPPIQMLRPETPTSIAALIDRTLLGDPARRFESVGALLRALERLTPTAGGVVGGVDVEVSEGSLASEERRLRIATGIDYEVLSKLGDGTFGSVWRVRDLSLEREVALKMLHPHISEREENVARFRREAQLAAQLAHPAIVPIFHWDRRGEVVWYTMELAEGGSVADLVRRLGPRTLSEVAQQVDLVLDALAVAHDEGIIHRDLKPENLLIDRRNNWRIGDFGLANAFGEEYAGASGTPAFSAPEQLLGEAQGPSVDLFAVAAITAYVLTGEPPFAGLDAPAVLARQLRGQVDADLSALPADLQEWIRRGLAAEVAQRFRSAREMQQAWRALALIGQGV